MLTKELCDKLNEGFEGTMNRTLGIRFLPSEDKDSVWGEMPINNNTRQYFGILHGGASLAFAETLAGCGSLCLIDFDKKKKVCGIEVTGNHIGMSATEGKVIGKATLVHAGKTLHIWNVDIKGEDGRLISTERVTNMIISPN